MLTRSNQIYRITYEAFSKFSNNLNNCRSLEDIAECFSINLKYLFNFHIFRASYHHNGVYIHLQSSEGHTTLTESRNPAYLPFEEFALNSTRPFHWSDLSVFSLPPEYNLPPAEAPGIWAWNFSNQGSRQILASVLSGNNKIFSQKDINFLKLVAENLETKLLEICLIKELDEKNVFISKLNTRQQEIIAERTKELAKKNKVLSEISVLNAHAVREPLSRILGLVELLNMNLTGEEIMEIISYIKKSSVDLDVALQDVIQRTSADLLVMNG